MIHRSWRVQIIRYVQKGFRFELIGSKQHARVNLTRCTSVLIFVFLCCRFTPVLAQEPHKKVECAILGYPSNQYALQAGFKQLTALGKTEYGLFPNVAIGVRESWLKTPRNREQAVSFLRAFSEGLALAKKDAALSKKVMRKYARLTDEVVLQASFEFYKDQFPQTLRVDERSYANLLRYLDHPKAAGADSQRILR